MPAPSDESEAHRHACEVRWLAARPTDAARTEYLALVEKRRGPAAANRLRRDTWAFLNPAPPKRAQPRDG